MLIDVRAELGGRLLTVEKPGRYVGGEYGTVHKRGEDLLRVAVSYPDLYEIGMSNHSVRLLYRLLNRREEVACERVFAPAPDFEALLKSCGLPIYSLESGRPLREFDLIGFSFGYELCMTNMLAILDLAGIGLRSDERGPDDPIVLAGGPAVTNPLPYGAFVDAVLIGEAEQWLDEIFGSLARLKREGAGRRELLEFLRSADAVWYAGQDGPVRRAHFGGFGVGPVATDNPAAPAETSSMVPCFPVPNIKTVQDQGAVEIMRGCPHGCRFCHASIFYRPFRLKDSRRVAAETDELVFGCGYREITLSSLSSGDYPDIGELVRALNLRYADHRVSFSLPSLRINSLTLDLLTEVSSVRKSGLTFALETPLPEWQQGINKPAPVEKTIAILKEAKKRGWRLAKFYFMVGLPVSEGSDETGPIIELLRRIKSETGMSLNVNISCFIPKPHTAYQWARQLSEEEGLDRIMTVKRAFAGRAGVKIRYHSPFQSILEGLVSRGDERAGELVHRAYLAGARLDAWEEMVDWDIWRRVFAEADFDVEASICREREEAEDLPWDAVRIGATKSFLRREYRRSVAGELTGCCAADCGRACGACSSGSRGIAPRDTVAPPDTAVLSRSPASSAGRRARLLFSFGKQGPALFWGHLNIMQIFERALLRAGYRAQFTEGFNPKPKIEFAHPLSLGIASAEEIAGLEVLNFDNEDSFRERLSQALPEGLAVSRVRELPPYVKGRKKHSLMALYWGSDFLIRPAAGAGSAHSSDSLDAALRDADAEARLGVHSYELTAAGLFVRYKQSEKGAGNIFKLLARLGVEEPQRLSVRRLAVWAKDPRLPNNLEPADYFNLDI
jgi:radical SAM family uncharacterized protein/radical SAM-linked protein